LGVNNIEKKGKRDCVRGGKDLPTHIFFPHYLILTIFFIAMLPARVQAIGAIHPHLQEDSGSLPVVAIHVSELTQNLEKMRASSSTPHSDQTTGEEWWNTSWHYFTIYEAVEEALRSDGTPFVEVSDADISAGRLMTSAGLPRYPILISLASEAVQDDEIAPLRSFVAAGGFLFAGSSAFTRYPNGKTRHDFALADEMGLHMAASGLDNWKRFTKISKLVDQRILSDLPAGTLYWDMPATSDQLGLVTERQRKMVSKSPFIWAVNAGDAQVIAESDVSPFLAIKSYGKGEFIYYAPLQPLIGFNGYNPSTYSYLIFRRAIEWAFEASLLPLVKLSPWQYPYDAAIVFRHDFEQDPRLVNSIEDSAKFEQSLGARGDYYFTTGLVQVGTGDHSLTNAQKRAIVKSIQKAVADNGATIGSHNGGLPWPGSHPIFSLLERLSFLRSWNIFPFSTGVYDWHWGPDEVLNTIRFGYPDGVTYASTSIEASFHDLQIWLKGLDNGRPGCGARDNCPRIWAAPYFNSVREDSLKILEAARVITAGEQKIGPFPHWTLSTQTAGKHYSFLSLPVSEWYINDRTAQTIDDHTLPSLKAAVDFYYNLGALVNFYSHRPSNDGGLAEEYIRYGLSKPRIWSTNAVGVYDWWKERSAVHVSVSYTQKGVKETARAAITGAVDPETAIEVVLPEWSKVKTGEIQVLLNGVSAASSEYRATAYGLKIRVGSTVSYVEVRYNLP
jgi:hypothetical protein